MVHLDRSLCYMQLTDMKALDKYFHRQTVLDWCKFCFDVACLYRKIYYSLQKLPRATSDHQLLRMYLEGANKEMNRLQIKKKVNDIFVNVIISWGDGVVRIPTLVYS